MIEHLKENGYIYFWIFLFTCFAAWVTHIVTCLINETYLLLIAGALVFPVAIINGIMTWFS